MLFSVGWPRNLGQVYLGWCSLDAAILIQISWSRMCKEKKITRKKFIIILATNSKNFKKKLFFFFTDCHQLNVYVLPKTRILQLNAQYDGIRRWGLKEVLRAWGWSLINGISALIKKIALSSLALRRHHLWRRSPRQTPNVQVPWYWTSQAPEL